MAQETPSSVLGAVEGLAGLVRLEIAHGAVLEALGVGDCARDDVGGVGQPGGQECCRDGAVGGLELLPGVGDRAQRVGVGGLQLVDEKNESLVVGVLCRGLGGMGDELTERARGLRGRSLRAGELEAADSGDPRRDLDLADPSGQYVTMSPGAGELVNLIGDHCCEGSVAGCDEYRGQTEVVRSALGTAQQAGLAHTTGTNLHAHPSGEAPLEGDPTQQARDVGELGLAPGNLASGLTWRVGTRLQELLLAAQKIRPYRSTQL